MVAVAWTDAVLVTMTSPLVEVAPPVCWKLAWFVAVVPFAVVPFANLTVAVNCPEVPAGRGLTKIHFNWPVAAVYVALVT